MTEIEAAKELDVSRGYVDLLTAVVRQAHHDSADKRKDKLMMQDARIFMEWARNELVPFLLSDDVPYTRSRVGRRLIL